MDIYGSCRPSLEAVMETVKEKIERYGAAVKEERGTSLYEHLSCRLKTADSMEEKLRKRGLPLTAESALYGVRDAIGFRVVCRFIDDVYENVRRIKAFPGAVVVKEKDYIRHVKPNGYRSYHLVLDITAPHEDARGRMPGRFFAEFQLRTLAMDSWAALEHEMKYKKDVAEASLISRELKRCADELASCDVSMQTIRDLIRHE